MKKVNFKSITLENFLSYQEPQTFNFKGKGLTLLSGKNGDGKSAIPSAMYYALFGKSDRDTVGDLVNYNVGKKCKVELELEVNGTNYKIIRGTKPGIFEIYQDGKKIEQSSSTKEHQKILYEILGFNEIIFYQLIYLGANISQSKNFLELSQKEKEEVFNILIDVSKFNELRDKTKEYKKYLQSEVKNQEQIRSILENDIKNLSKSIKDQEKQNEEIIKNKETLLENITKEIKDLEEEIKNIDQKLLKKEKVLLLIKEYKEKISNLENKFNSNKELYSELKHKQTAWYKNEDSKIICPKCGTEIKNKLDYNIEEIEDQLKDLKETLKSQKSELNELKEELEKYKNALSKLEQLEFKKEQIQNQIKKLNDRYNNIKNMKEIKIDYSILKLKEKDLKKLEEKIIELNSKIDECNELITLLSEDNLKGEYIAEYIPLLNYYVNMYLEKLSVAFTIKFNNRFKETIYHNNKEISFKSLSNGQKMRIIIAILFAFLKLIELKSNINFNILFLDEFINGSLDIYGVEDTLNNLKEFVIDKEIILITHNNDIKQQDELFSRVVEIKKDNWSMIIER